ncbi:MAG TPA: VUT family protein [Victivallales bacterium]|nr:VUT family protein [Victivallales bacterium]
MKDVYVRKSFTPNSRCLLFLAMLYIAILCACSAVGYKIVGYRVFILNSAAVLYPLTYIISDTIAEVYGYAIMKKIIWFGIITETIFASLVVLMVYMPGLNTPYQTKAITFTLGAVLRFVLSSIFADICSSFTNVWIISKMKVKMHGKRFWFRGMVALIASEFIIASISVIFAFAGRESIITVIEMSFSVYIFMLLFGCILIIPTTYVIRVIRNFEKIDVYEEKIRFNPFVFSSKD